MFIRTFFVTMTDTITSQNIDLSSWITLYVQAYISLSEISGRMWASMSLCY